MMTTFGCSEDKLTIMKKFEARRFLVFRILPGEVDME